MHLLGGLWELTFGTNFTHTRVLDVIVVLSEDVFHEEVFPYFLNFREASCQTIPLFQIPVLLLLNREQNGDICISPRLCTVSLYNLSFNSPH